MAGSLQCGQIIWAAIADANGIPKSRPAVIITPDDQITPGGTFQVVAITSTLADPLPPACALALARSRTSTHRIEAQVRRCLLVVGQSHRQGRAEHFR